MPDSSQVSLCYPYGSPILSGSIKSQPEDFIVREQLGFDPVGEGEHLFLFIEKRSLTTHELIDQLAKIVGIQPRQISYSGLKDKHALTQQWISLHMPGCKDFPNISDTDTFRILRRDWHDRKLRVGTHKANEFIVTVKDVKGQIEQFDELIQNIQTFGFANYFGEQRFGQNHDNVQQALRILNNRHKRKRLTRTKKSLFLSALRSELFNQILSERIKQGIWKEPLEGDVYTLAGSQSIFHESLDSEIKNRYKTFDLHSGISLFGSGDTRNDLAAKELEHVVYEKNPEIVQTLKDSEVKLSYRANRAVANNLQVEKIDGQQIVIKVELTKGSYVTSLLNHIIDFQAA